MCHKLRMPGIDIDLIEKVLINYVTMYNGPLCGQVVVGLSMSFGLEDAFIDSMDDVLLGTS